MITRRRFLTIGATMLSAPALASESQEWTGQALGSAARIVLSGVTNAAAVRIFAKVESLVRQVEAQFSLYQDSELVRLNRNGWLSHPDASMRDICDLVDRIHEATSGLFDPTIQPLWLAIANGEDLAKAEALIGWSRVRRSLAEIRLDYRMQLTFNGIAQGYAADRVAALMREEGFNNVLVDMGEISGLGERPAGGSWQAEIVLPDGTRVASASLSNRALATSSPSGTLIGHGSPHIINPLGGAPRWQLVSISAPEAAVADALSTAFCLMDRPAMDRALQSFPHARIEALV